MEQNINWKSSLPEWLRAEVSRSLSSSRFCDVKVTSSTETGGKWLACHSSILAAASPFLKYLIRGQSSLGMEVALILDADWTTIKSLLRFMYGLQPLFCQNRAEKKHFQQWLQILKIKEFSTDKMDENDVECDQFECPVCDHLSFFLNQETLKKHLEGHLNNMSDLNMELVNQYRNRPWSGLNEDMKCPGCCSVIVHIQETRPTERKDKFQNHLKECYKRIHSLTEGNLAEEGRSTTTRRRRSSSGKQKCPKCGDSVASSENLKLHSCGTLLGMAKDGETRRKKSEEGPLKISNTSQKPFFEGKCQKCGEEVPNSEVLRLHSCKSKLNVIADERNVRESRVQKSMAESPPDSPEKRLKMRPDEPCGEAKKIKKLTLSKPGPKSKIKSPQPRDIFKQLNKKSSKDTGTPQQKPRSNNFDQTTQQMSVTTSSDNEGQKPRTKSNSEASGSSMKRPNVTETPGPKNKMKKSELNEGEATEKAKKANCNSTKATDSSSVSSRSDPESESKTESPEMNEKSSKTPENVVPNINFEWISNDESSDSEVDSSSDSYQASTNKSLTSTDLNLPQQQPSFKVQNESLKSSSESPSPDNAHCKPRPKSKSKAHESSSERPKPTDTPRSRSSSFDTDYPNKSSKKKALNPMYRPPKSSQEQPLRKRPGPKSKTRGSVLTDEDQKIKDFLGETDDESSPEDFPETETSSLICSECSKVCESAEKLAQHIREHKDMF